MPDFVGAPVFELGGLSMLPVQVRHPDSNPDKHPRDFKSLASTKKLTTGWGSRTPGPALFFL